MEQNIKPKLENYIELLKVVIWPLVTILIIIIYHQNIKELINNSSKVSVGTFSMEIKREAKNQGFSELGDLITSLDEKELRLLLSIAESGNFGLIGRNSTEYFLPENTKTWENLAKHNLVKFVNFKINDVENYFLKVGGKKEIVYYNDKNAYSFTKNEEFYIESYNYKIDINKISDSDKEKLEAYTISITEKGKQSIDIITNTIIEQLKQ